MNKQKANGYPKLLVIFLVGLLLIFSVGLVADGWQSSNDKNEYSGKIENPDNDNADNNTNNDDTDQSPSIPESYIPQYVNPLTGLETTEILSSKRHGAFIFNSTSPLYGISYSDILIELPIENGDTRYLALINDLQNIGKIGALSPSRDYISNSASYFGAYTVHNGFDGLQTPEKIQANQTLDLSLVSGYHYTEFNDLVYSNGGLLTTGITSSGISILRDPLQALPYGFVPFNDENIKGEKEAVSISLPYSDKNITEIRYSSQDGKYTLIKNGSARVDMLNNKILGFDNCILLYADSITYETIEGCDFIMDTSSFGNGYYITGGTVKNISWAVSDGTLSLLDENGEKLIINRGSSYIGYLKASMYDKTLFS